uniref:Zinc finger CCCH domain-containing protein 3 n=1 Tax=Schistocephalus solidus TaxID=70667 RepID=A0A0V0JBF8_SCHSO
MRRSRPFGVNHNQYRYVNPSHSHKFIRKGYFSTEGQGASASCLRSPTYLGPLTSHASFVARPSVFSYRKPTTSNNVTKINAPSLSPSTTLVKTRFKIYRKVTKTSPNPTSRHQFDSRVASKYKLRRIRKNKLSPKPSSDRIACHSPPQTTYKHIVKKAIQTLRYRRQPVCLHFIRTGTCRNNDSCRFSHAADHVKICPKFLSHTCRLGEAKCPLAHVLDPCRIPQCDFFAKGDCKRESCPYLHVKYAENTVSCPSFLNGRCELAQKCTKRHVWPAIPRKKFKNREPAHHLSEPQTNDCAVVATRRSSPLEKAPDGSLRDVFPAPSFIPFEVLDTP